jgi:AsmA family protein
VLHVHYSSIEGPIIGSFAIRRWLVRTVAALAALILLAAGLAAALDAGYFRGPIIRFLAARAQRQIQVGGVFEVHLFTLKPRLIAERVAIGNPPWMPSGTTAVIEKISVTIELPGFGHGFGIARLEMQGATLRLARDSRGHANWQLSDPDKSGAQNLPIIYSLSMPNAQVVLDDALRHLQFSGTVSARDQSRGEGLHLLQIDGAGQSNGRAATFEILGDALTTASHERPYHFTFAERSSGSRLTGRGFLLRSFDFNRLDTTFAAEGADLKDLYFLTGVTLVNTGSYHVSGTLTRRGTASKFGDLIVTSGQSDIRGTVSVESSSGRPQLDADLDSQVLRLSDLGPSAAGRAAEAGTGPPLLLSNTMLSPKAVRHGDAVVSFRARRVDVGRVSLHAVAAKMTINHGILVVAPLTAEVLQGKLWTRLRLDATTEAPAAELDLKITDLQLGQIDRKQVDQPPVEGLLQARIRVSGHGRSVHQVAASANGTVTAVLPHGVIRDSLAKLSGLDLGGLARLLTKNRKETPIRCGVASFQAHEGTLTAQSMVVDTDPVLITGDGAIHLDSEALDLAFHGHPKSFELLRVRSPLLLGGTLSHPSIDIKARNSVVQVTEAVALGVVFTPLAALLAFVDPGLTKDADCAALIAAAKGFQTKAAPPPP